jgi:hypothetical protein
MNDNPKIGLVLAAYAATPYMHLHLESRRRNGIDIPTIIHDDASPEKDRLAELCSEYKVQFYCNPQEIGWQAGAYFSNIYSIEWGLENNLDLVVWFTRRFIPLFNWLPSLLALDSECHASAYTNATSDYKMRSECMALSVPKWATLLEHMHKDFDENHDAINHHPLEPRIYDLACRLMPEGFAIWDALITNPREKFCSDVLSHQSHPSDRYFHISQEWGLPYTLRDFVELHAEGYYRPYPNPQEIRHYGVNVQENFKHW